jgi:SAM-dependent methyltransferase
MKIWKNIFIYKGRILKKCDNPKDNSFWDNMAKTYPHYDDESMSKDVNRILNWARERGVNFENNSVLDIGCGTGTIAIPLALEGATVTGVDVSEAMISLFSADIESLNLKKSIQTHQSTWGDFNVSKTYDVVIASMTPAISSTEHIDKMIDSTDDKGLYVGWGAYRNNIFLEELCTLHNVIRKTSGGCVKAKQFIEYLQEKDLDLDYEYFDSSWQDEYSVEKAIEYACEQLEFRQVKPQKELINKILPKFTCNDKVIIETKAQKGVIMFSKHKGE